MVEEFTLRYWALGLVWNSFLALARPLTQRGAVLTGIHHSRSSRAQRVGQ